MKSKNIFLIFVIPALIVLTFKPSLTFATPSADDILKACQTAFQTNNFQTQHLVYKITTIVAQGVQAPVTNIQTVEVYKKLPDLMKVTTDNGYSTQVIISKGGVAYIQSPGSGKFTPVKGVTPGNPFQNVTQSIATNFSTTTVNQADASTYEITVTGGKLPKFVDHAMLRVDATTNTITHLEGVDKKGTQVLVMDITYQKIGTAMQLKHFDSATSYKKMSANISMDVLTNEINQNVDSGVFNVQ